ncbi:MAG: ribonuclease III domain-containing protein [Promethearchaeota archaeon]
MTRGEKGLSWEPIELQEKLQVLLDAVTETENETPKENTRTLRKTKRWREQLDEIILSLHRIQDILSIRLEAELGISLKNNELLQVAMFQPSTKNLFSELEIHYTSSEQSPLDEEVFHVLVSLSEMAKALALVGDAAISMAVLHHIWQPKATDVGTLTQRRADLVSNEHLAKVCDEWGLYEHRIHFEPVEPSKSEIDHDKGTLTEAVYGIVYIEHGLKKVKDLVPKLTW